MKVSPAVRLTFGVVSLTLSLLLVADFLGFVPDGEKAVIEQRKHFAEMLSVQMSLATQKHDVAALQAILWAAVKRNDDLLSAGVRRKNLTLLVQFGDHQDQWGAVNDTRNTSTRMSLPIIQGQESFGRVELRFKPVAGVGLLSFAKGKLLGLVLFVVIGGSFSYWFLLNRSLRYLDPSSVVPDRVRSALDVLANGVLIVDENECIVLANAAFIKKCGYSHKKSLIGLKPSRLKWQRCDDRREPGSDFPWLISLESGEEKVGFLLRMPNESGGERTFLVNSAPIYDENDKLKGAMIGFDDVTDIEEKNAMLNSMLKELEQSKSEVEKRNEKLHVLATRDPLTHCYNRRAFNDKFNKILEKAELNNEPVSCIMTDIDHFKLVNDTHGHAAGDEIIKLVASTLNDNVRVEDVVGRYGGEEFCIILPGINAITTQAIAERCRRHIQSKEYNTIKVTSSFGVSSTDWGCANSEMLVQQADEALYVSKDKGRNRVTLWRPPEDDVLEGS